MPTSTPTHWRIPTTARRTRSASPRARSPTRSAPRRSSPTPPRAQPPCAPRASDRKRRFWRLPRTCKRHGGWRWYGDCTASTRATSAISPTWCIARPASAIARASPTAASASSSLPGSHSARPAPQTCCVSPGSRPDFIGRRNGARLTFRYGRQTIRVLRRLSGIPRLGDRRGPDDTGAGGLSEATLRASARPSTADSPRRKRSSASACCARPSSGEATHQPVGETVHQSEIERGTRLERRAFGIEHAGSRMGAFDYRLHQARLELRLAEDAGGAERCHLGVDRLDALGAGYMLWAHSDRADCREAIAPREILVGVVEDDERLPAHRRQALA